MGRTSWIRPGIAAATALVATGCVTPVRMAVTPITPPQPAVVEAPCAAPDGACLVAGEPTYRVRFAAGEEIVWLQVGGDGTVAVASLAPSGYHDMKTADIRYSLAAVDLAGGRELWRLSLSPDAPLHATQPLFLGGRLGITTSLGAFVVLDLRTGRELWRRDPAVTKGLDLVHLAWADLDHGQLFLAGYSGTQAVEIDTGRVLATLPAATDFSPWIAGARPLTTPEDHYLFDGGLVRLARGSLETRWRRPFVTFAMDDHTGANVALTVVGALLGSGAGGNIPPDFYVGRTVPPVAAGDRLITAALGVVHAIDPTSGELLWSSDLAVPKVRALAARDGRAYVLAGGPYVYWGGRAGISVGQSVRGGLYALDLETGVALDGFAGPFNANRVARQLTPAQVAAYDWDDAWEEEEDWPDEDAKGAAGGEPTAHSRQALAGMALTPEALLVVDGDRIARLDPRTGAELSSDTLGELGEALLLSRHGDRLVVRAKAGVAVLDGASGEVLFTRPTTEPEDFRWYGDPGHVPFLDRADWVTFADIEVRAYWKHLYWAPPGSGLLLLPAAGGRLEAISLADGAKVWELQVPLYVRLDAGDGWWDLCVIDGAVAELYRSGAAPRGLEAAGAP